MAGDWIKFEVSTPEKQEVLAITVAMGWDDPDLTVGKLLRVWRWFDQQTVEGNAPGVSAALLDRIAGVSGFAKAMADVGWLIIEESGISLPNFGRHNGKTAKERALTAKRVAAHKAKANGEGNAASVSEALPREREEKKEKHSSAGADQPLPGFDRFWETWPRTERKTAKAECRKRWKARGLEALADQIVRHVEAMAQTRQWREGFEPAPLTYLNQRRWEDAAPDGIATAMDEWGIPL